MMLSNLALMALRRLTWKPEDLTGGSSRLHPLLFPVIVMWCSNVLVVRKVVS